MEAGATDLDEVEEPEDDGIDTDIAVIIDNGSGVCKAGLSCHDAPSAVFPEAVGRPRQDCRSSMERSMYFGDEVLPCGNAPPEVWNRFDKLSITHPLENGIIENFECMEQLWEYTFEQLHVNPARHPVLLTEPPYNPKPNRERMVEIMFEVFGVPMLNISIQGVLALLGQGRTTGLVLDSGEGVTHTIPIFDGFGLPHCINRTGVAGYELNTLLAKLIAQEGTILTKTVDKHAVREMKEKYCYVALEPGSEFAETVTHKLPDGREIHLSDERWKTPEALFTPSMVGLESETNGRCGAAGMVWDSITRCDIDIRKTLLSNVVLSGGSTTFRGFSERLTKELRHFAPSAVQAGIRVLSSKDPKLAVWNGAQVFASLRAMQEEDQWISIEDYDEYGAQCIHDKMAVRYS